MSQNGNADAIRVSCNSLEQILLVKMDLHDRISQLSITSQHKAGLKDAISFASNITEPIGIVVSGSIVRGNPNPSSDLDIVTLHDGSWRRRVQQLFNGTPTELFFNSGEWLHYCITDEAARGRPVMAHMLSTGVLLADRDGRMAGVIATARAILSKGPEMGASALLTHKYLAACKVEDALDFQGMDVPDARQAIYLAVDALVQYFYLARNLHLPRPKERLSLLAETEPEVARLLSMALREVPMDALASLELVSQMLLDVTGFFEWDSGPDDTAPPTRL